MVIFNLDKSDINIVLDVLYVQWDLCREDLEYKKADRIAKIRDNVVQQYNTQLQAEKSNNVKSK